MGRELFESVFQHPIINEAVRQVQVGYSAKILYAFVQGDEGFNAEFIVRYIEYL